MKDIFGGMDGRNNDYIRRFRGQPSSKEMAKLAKVREEQTKLETKLTKKYGKPVRIGE